MVKWHTDRLDLMVIPSKAGEAPAQWGLNRVPYGSADFLLQAVAVSPQSAKWLLVGPFCAGSLLA